MHSQKCVHCSPSISPAMWDCIGKITVSMLPHILALQNVSLNSLPNSENEFITVKASKLSALSSDL